MSIEFCATFDRVAPVCASASTEFLTLKSQAPASQSPRPPISPRRLAANRRNAERSTGPRTAAGKARSSRNALKHGLCCAVSVRLSSECSATYNIFIEELREELRPRSVTDAHLFNQICTVLWRLNRLPEAQRDLFSIELEQCAQNETLTPAQVLARRFSQEPTRNAFLLLERYERGLRNQLLRLLSQYHRLRRQRATETREQNLAEAPAGHFRPAWDPKKPGARCRTSEGTEAAAAIHAEARARADLQQSNPIQPIQNPPADPQSTIPAPTPPRAGAERTHFDDPTKGPPAGFLSPSPSSQPGPAPQSADPPG